MIPPCTSEPWKWREIFEPTPHRTPQHVATDGLILHCSSHCAVPAHINQQSEIHEGKTNKTNCASLPAVLRSALPKAHGPSDKAIWRPHHEKETWRVKRACSISIQLLWKLQNCTVDCFVNHVFNRVLLSLSGLGPLSDYHPAVNSRKTCIKHYKIIWNKYKHRVISASLLSLISAHVEGISHLHEWNSSRVKHIVCMQKRHNCWTRKPAQSAFKACSTAFKQLTAPDFKRFWNLGTWFEEQEPPPGGKCVHIIPHPHLHAVDLLF